MYVTLIILGLLVIGFVSYLFKFKNINKKISFALEYRNSFCKYLDSKGNDNSLYGWLIYRSNKMQNQMGPQGLISKFKPPYTSYIYSNYPIILNMIPALNDSLHDSLLYNQSSQYARAIDEALLRYNGSLNDKHEYIYSRLHSPIAWLQEGISQTVGTPIYVLSVFGIISMTTAGRIISSMLFRTTSGLITLIGLVSSVIGLVVGWDDFLLKISMFIKN